MKRYILVITLSTAFMVNALPAQTADNLQNLVNSEGNRSLTLTNDITFDFGRFGTVFDDGGVITITRDVVDAQNNPSNAFSLTSSTGAFLDVSEISTLNLTNIKISNNTSTGTNFITNNGTLHITNSIISDNLSGQGSSVVSNFGSLFIDASLFENNSIEKSENNPNGLGRGAAIRNSGNALITNSTFRANSSQHGSAIYNTETGTMEVINSVFENNFSTNGTNYSYGSIFNQGTLIVRDSIFQNNTMGAGGGIYNEGNATIYDSYFITNTATGLGGGVNNGKLATLTIYDSTFNGNEGTGASAAINSAHGGNVNIIRSTIENHTVISDVDSGNYDRDNGGAMYFYGVEFERNEDLTLVLDKNGHAIVKTPTGQLYIEDSKFLNNTVSRGGGAIYSTGYATIIDTLFEGNSSDLKHGVENPDDYNAGTAGAFYDYNFTDIPTTIKGSTFKNNSAYSAGAIYHPAGHLIIDDTLFEGNTAINQGGGGALMNGGVGSLVLTNSRFIGNYAGLGGALSQMSENDAYIASSHFEKNTSNSYGGALYLRPYRNSSTPENVKTYTKIVNSHFVQNSSNGSGGAIYLQSDLDLTGSTFTENTANVAGGAMYILDPSVATIRDGVFLGNRAGNGGAIRNSGSITIYDSLFDNNNASGGSAILNDGTLSVYNSLFQNNVSTYDFSNDPSFDPEKKYSRVTGVIDGNGTTNIYNSSFLNNYHNPVEDCYYSGAITGRGVVNIIANNGISLISGNTSNGSSAGLFVRPDAEINLFAGSSGGTTGTLVINDAISIMASGNLHINKNNGHGFATDGVIEINDTITHLDGSHDSIYSVNLYNGTLKFGSAIVNYEGKGNDPSFGNISDKVTFNVYGGKISTADGDIRSTNLGNLNLFSDALYDLDVDLNNAVSDIPTATSYVSNGYGFLIDTIHLFGDTDKRYTEVVVSDGSIDVGLSEKTVAAYTPMYRYEIDDTKLSSDGILGFTRDMDTYKGYNPNLYASSIALLTGSHLSNISLQTKKLLKPRVNDELQFNVRPYLSYQKVALVDGYDVDSTHYGTSFDVSVTNKLVISATYVGSYQSYESTSQFQNGGQLSLAYYYNINNLFINSAASISGAGVQATTLYGNELFPILAADIATNLGYDFDLTSTVSLIPSVQASYAFSKSLDYTSAAGLEIKTTPLNAFTVLPSIAMLGKIDTSLSLNAYVMGNFSFLFGAKTTVDDVHMPEMKLGHYVQYGVGLTKKIVNNRNIEMELTGYNFSRSGIDFSMSASFFY